MTKFAGVTYPLFDNLIERGDSGQNILIAGMCGSGKSSFTHGMINSILYKNGYEHKLVLIDPKYVEFGRYEGTLHCIRYADTIRDIEDTLNEVLDTIMARLLYMKQKGIDMYDGSTIHLFIDELADLMLTSKSVSASLQRICQIGRAARVQVVCATQCPLATVIPTRIKVNFPIVVGLHTQTAQHSRNIIDESGCEELPMFGEALIKYPTIGIKKVKVPYVDKEQLNGIINASRK